MGRTVAGSRDSPRAVAPPPVGLPTPGGPGAVALRRRYGPPVADPTALDYVTLGIAGVGAVTGLAALGATWAQFALSGPRVKVTTGTGYGGGNWLVTVTNTGRTPVSIGNVGLSLHTPHGHADDHVPIGLEQARNRASGPPIPVRLEPYSEATWHLPASPLCGSAARAGTSVRSRPTDRSE